MIISKKLVTRVTRRGKVSFRSLREPLIRIESMGLLIEKESAATVSRQEGLSGGLAFLSRFANHQRSREAGEATPSVKQGDTFGEARRHLR